MARPRKPTQLHVVSGSARKHPDRMRERESEPETGDTDLRDIPPPDGFQHPDIWREVQQMLHARVAGQNDHVAFEALCHLIAKMRGGEAAAADYARLQAFLGEFGMTPASRSKVSQGKAQDKPKGFAALKAG